MFGGREIGGREIGGACETLRACAAYLSSTLTYSTQRVSPIYCRKPDKSGELAQIRSFSTSANKTLDIRQNSDMASATPSPRKFEHIRVPSHYTPTRRRRFALVLPGQPSITAGTANPGWFTSPTAPSTGSHISWLTSSLSLERFRPLTSASFDIHDSAINILVLPYLMPI